MSLAAFVFSLIRHGPNILIYPGAFEAHPRELYLPSQYGLPYEDLALTTSDRVEIRAYLMLQPEGLPDDQACGSGRTEFKSNAPNLDSESKRPTRQPVVLMFHGNADNIGYTIPLANEFYTRMKCHVLMLSPRGYGRSKGRPSTKGLKRDADAALTFVKTHVRLSKCPIILYGQSMGGAFAINLASRHPEEINGLIVENTFLSLRRLIPDATPMFSAFAPFFRQWNSVARIAKMSPSLRILMLSGLCDEVVPPEHMRGLWAAANPDGSKRGSGFFEFVHGCHNDTWDQPGYWDAVANFIDNLRETL